MVETMTKEKFAKANFGDSPQTAHRVSPLTEAQLVDEYGGAVYKFCRSITCTKEDADDLYQDTFISVFSQMHKIEKAGSPKSFLLSTAAYQWKSRRRKYARRYRLAPEVEINEDVTALADLGGVEDNLLSTEERLAVRALVDALPIKLKIPVILLYTNEMRVAEIAAVLSLPVGTVMSRLHKARAVIKKGLVSYYGCN